MGGKGRRRREKNYRAAHGGNSRLPPPPNPSSVDAVPSKLRKIMALTNPSQPANRKQSERNNPGNGGGHKKKLSAKKELVSQPIASRGDDDDSHPEKLKDMDHVIDNLQNSVHEKREKTKKRKQVKDLRFEKAEELGMVGVKRRERKRKYREERKKKHKKARLEGDQDFLGCEKIKFGEVAEAPPKLVAVPKALKTSQDVSRERLRLKAIEGYRNRKGWASRPGINLPATAIASSSP